MLSSPYDVTLPNPLLLQRVSSTLAYNRYTFGRNNYDAYSDQIYLTHHQTLLCAHDEPSNTSDDRHAKLFVSPVKQKLCQISERSNIM